MTSRVPVATPEELFHARSSAIIDVRDREERESALGFIPGSRSFPAAELAVDASPLLEAYPEGMPFVLVCLSGRRSADVASKLMMRGIHRVVNLEGGVLGWHAAGLPVCGVEDVSPELVPRIQSIGDLPRRIVSCFVAEAAEAALDAGVGPLEDDPRAIAEALLATARADDGLRPAAVVEALERLGEIARFRGHPMANIARNLDAMRAALLPFLRAG